MAYPVFRENHQDIKVEARKSHLVLIRSDFSEHCLFLGLIKSLDSKSAKE
jgi:hypothetical protein